ncbi:metallophosphoesterase [uncultured Parabacteroides sp.]|jgi:UDP-2,3-diacylglucosamine pyrophosphatase LpxH|uniref:metallophosphoesterase n=1 Tax=uncultured Parabacteroides sp. TaxID=512312 RepID=UPI0025F91580|nr:metallophosphoesterase [uncultured Parabacteroides sp.]
MKKYLNKQVLLSIVSLLILISCEKEEENEPVRSGEFMTVSINVNLLESKNILFLAEDSVQEIILTFSEPIYENSISNGIHMKAFYRGSTEAQILSPEITSANDKKNILYLKLPKKNKFDSHALFQLNITTELISTSGSILEKEVDGMFYVGGKDCLDSDLPESTQNKKAIVIVSDIHMGDQRSQDRGYCWFKDNKQLFSEFIDYLIVNSHLLDKLVIAGDFMDEWVAPMNTETFADEYGNQISQHEFVGKIIVANQEIVNKLKELHQHEVEIVYLPGNHDMLVTAEDFDFYFGKDVITQSRDMQGLGRYEPREYIVIEHGHRYDYFNAPDPLSNKGIDQVNDNSILPPGFFVSKIASSSDLEAASFKRSKAILPNFANSYTEDKKNWFELALAWPLILSTKPVSEEISGKYIKTNIDGLTRDYTLKDVSDWYVTTDPDKCRKPLLYRTSFEAEEWNKRLKANGVLNTEKVPFETGLVAGIMNNTFENLAKSQYIEETTNPKRIVVFGHTHEATITNIGNSVYVNSGTWIDKKWAPNMPERTFVVLQEYEGNNKENNWEISLFSFEKRNQINKIGSTFYLSHQ